MFSTYICAVHFHHTLFVFRALFGLVLVELSLKLFKGSLRIRVCLLRGGVGRNGLRLDLAWLQHFVRLLAGCVSYGVGLLLGFGELLFKRRHTQIETFNFSLSGNLARKISG